MSQQSFHVAYDHELAAPFHSVSGAREALRLIFPDGMPRSVLDVGCGTGTWLSASLDEGASEVLGIDGGMLSPQQLYIPASQVRHADLNQPLKLGRLFDLVLCLETAEHLEPENAATIVETLTGHGDRILFSAAAPGQQGMHHVNCRWPVYWQQLFNDLGFACSDWPRWAIWDNRNIEAWYRQNMFMAVRDPGSGNEPRLKAVVHPDMLEPWTFLSHDEIQSGGLRWSWYLRTIVRAVHAKVRRRLRRYSRA